MRFTQMCVYIDINMNFIYISIHVLRIYDICKTQSLYYSCTNTCRFHLNVKFPEVKKFIGCSFVGELASLRESENKYRQQYVEASHREKILVRRLASKEQELQEYIVCKHSQ